MTCSPSRPAGPEPCSPDGVPGDHGCALPLDGKRPALGRPQDGVRSPQERHDRGGAGREPDRGSQHPAEGNAPRKLADAGAGEELLAVPDRSTLKGKRDYVILAVLVGCALRREELAVLDVDTIQLREGRWVLVDLEGKGRRVRTVAIPLWVKQGINAWMTAAGVEDGEAASGSLQGRQSQREHERLGRLVGGRAVRQTDRDRAVRGARPAQNLRQASAGRMAAASNRSSFSWDIAPSKPRNAILALSRS